MNCLDDCRHDLMTYQNAPSATGEILGPDLSRRQFLTAAISGAAVIPVLRVSGTLGSNWNPALVRPPGALPENEFLSRCIKCGQCMRICPTNVIHPAGLEGGFEGLWTPVLNFRIGTSGCQFNCIACGHLCPTAAIRPLSLDERKGRNRLPIRGRLPSERLSSIGAAVCPGRWTGPVSSARKIARSALKPSHTRSVQHDQHRLKADGRKGRCLLRRNSSDRPSSGSICHRRLLQGGVSADVRPRRIISNWERGLKVAGELPLNHRRRLEARLKFW